jgi:hypothetical protein
MTQFRSSPTFRRKELQPLSMSKSKWRKQSASCKYISACLAYSSTLKMEAAHSSENSVNFYRLHRVTSRNIVLFKINVLNFFVFLIPEFFFFFAFFMKCKYFKYFIVKKFSVTNFQPIVQKVLEQNWFQKSPPPRYSVSNLTHYVHGGWGEDRTR